MKPIVLMLSAVVLLLLVYLAEEAAGAKILFYFVVSSYSHRIRVWPLVEELVSRGHNVTFFTAYPSRPPHQNKHVTEIVPDELVEYFNSVFGSDANLIQMRMEGTHEAVWTDLMVHGRESCKIICRSAPLVDWIKKNEFDLYVIDSLFNDCAMGFAYLHNAPFIAYNPNTVFMWQYDMFGFSAESSWIPDTTTNFPQQMSFSEKVYNVYSPLYWYFSRYWVIFSQIENELRTTFNIPNMPPLKELEMNTSLVLLNTHFSMEYGRSLPPLFVPIGGIQCQDGDLSRIPKDVLQFIEQGGDSGFMYVSFGSAAQISKMPQDFQQMFLNALGNSKVRVLWKYEAERPVNMPSNVFTSQWMTQQDILSHPKIRAFMTHAGLLSLEEGVYHSVPMIALPVFAEQDNNAEKLERMGFGIRLEFNTLTESKLSTAIQEILTNKKYKERVTEISKVFKDRPSSAVDTAVWWTEYVIRHKDTHFLRPLAALQPWYQNRLLDVWAFLALLLFTFGVIIVSIAGLCFKMLFSSKVTDKKQKQKRQ